MKDKKLSNQAIDDRIIEAFKQLKSKMPNPKLKEKLYVWRNYEIPIEGKTYKKGPILLRAAYITPEKNTNPSHFIRRVKTRLKELRKEAGTRTQYLVKDILTKTQDWEEPFITNTTQTQESYPRFATGLHRHPTGTVMVFFKTALNVLNFLVQQKIVDDNEAKRQAKAEKSLLKDRQPKAPPKSPKVSEPERKLPRLKNVPKGGLRRTRHQNVVRSARKDNYGATIPLKMPHKKARIEHQNFDKQQPGSPSLITPEEARSKKHRILDLEAKLQSERKAADLAEKERDEKKEELTKTLSFFETRERELLRQIDGEEGRLKKAKTETKATEALIRRFTFDDSSEGQDEEAASLNGSARLG